MSAKDWVRKINRNLGKGSSAGLEKRVAALEAALDKVTKALKNLLEKDE